MSGTALGCRYSHEHAAAVEHCGADGLTDQEVEEAERLRARPAQRGLGGGPRLVPFGPAIGGQELDVEPLAVPDLRRECAGIEPHHRLEAGLDRPQGLDHWRQAVVDRHGDVVILGDVGIAGLDCAPGRRTPG